MKQIRKETPLIKLDYEQTKNIIERLFISNPENRVAVPESEKIEISNSMEQSIMLKEIQYEEDYPEIGLDEVIRAAKKIVIRKAPGPDGIPALAAKKAALGATRF